MEDVRLSTEVEKVQEKNQEYIQEKSRRLANWIREYLTGNFEGKYDETFGFVLFLRKGNDINTLVVNTLMWAGITTWADRAMLRDSLHSLADAIDSNETDILDD